MSQLNALVLFNCILRCSSELKSYFKTFRTCNSIGASRSMRLMRLLLIFAPLISCSNGAQQLPCESVGLDDWSLSKFKTCRMRDSTIIDAPDFTIFTPREETVEALNFNYNKKISFLPLETANKFPNLRGYAAYECSIKVVKKENFQNLNKLQQIDLSFNQIETIFSDTFGGLISLEVLFLRKFLIKIFLQ